MKTGLLSTNINGQKMLNYDLQTKRHTQRQTSICMQAYIHMQPEIQNKYQ